MVTIESYTVAVVMCFITMLCWGSWANTQKLASKEWRFQLFYWDYCIGVLLLTLIIALTMGSIGSVGRGFITDIQQADSASIGWAMLGGVVFNLAPVPEAYKAPILFIGVACIAVAIIVNALAYRKLSTDKKTTTSGVTMAIAGNMNTPEAGKLTPYTALVFFSLGLFGSNFVFNTIAMKWTVSGEKVAVGDYFTKGNCRLHLVGILGGMIWGVGMSFSMIAGTKAGFAISYG
ncbi:MAG: multidrug DMT transporter permease, partial [Planctomycetota bacterium]